VALSLDIVAPVRKQVHSGRVDCELHVTLRRPGQPPVTRVLRCPPAGDHPQAVAACAALAAVTNPFAPVPKGVRTTMIYGGPETATVTGQWHGQPVHATFRRTNGAEIARWDRIAALLYI
jgi:Subtilisin inhibitor-like